MEPNVISITGAARAKGCHRTTIHRALERGELTAVELGGRRAILKDEVWGAWAPADTGMRLTGQGDATSPDADEGDR
jgi:excisionase family DNA binding protein